MALVIVAIGAGIGMAAAGVGYLVQSFKDLGDNALMQFWGFWHLVLRW